MLPKYICKSTAQASCSVSSLYIPRISISRCLNPITGHIHISRHVEFDEATFPNNRTQPHHTYTFLDEPPITTQNYNFPTTHTS
ncbi:hypothetical protein HanPI659440_Chr11g0416641 [Helianthus annuus]|nr:hypothetical protein HanPI659440_Chr11g0416641 [Helianthus annuus]